MISFKQFLLEAFMKESFILKKADDIRRMWNDEGKSITQISNELFPENDPNVVKVLMHRHANKMGLNKRGPTPGRIGPAPDSERALELIKKGLKYNQIGERLGKTKGSLAALKFKHLSGKYGIKEQFVDLGDGYHDHHANIEGHNVAIHFHDTGHIDFDVDGKDHLPKSNDPVQIRKNRKILFHVMNVVDQYTKDKKPNKLILQPNDDNKVSAYKTFANRIKNRFGGKVSHDNEESEVNFNWRRNVKGK